MNDWEAGTSGAAVTEDFDVFLNHRGPDVKATFVAHLEDALRCAGHRPFLDARSLRKGNPALQSIDQALAMAKVHVAVVSRGYAESKYCLKELVAMLRSGKPVVPVFYDVEPVELRWVENGPFAEAFEKHKSKGRSEKKVQEWREALSSLAGITGFRLADYKRDEARLKREVVNEVARLTPSNDPVEVEPYRVGLKVRANTCIEILENMGDGVGLLGLVGMGGVGKTTLAREIYNHFVAKKTFRCMTFLDIHRDSSASSVQVRPTWSRKLRKQLLWDLLRVQDNSPNYRSWFQKLSTLGPVLIVVDDVHKLEQFEALVPFASDLWPGSRIIVTSRDRSILNNVGGRSKVDHHLFDVAALDRDDSNMLFNWHAFQAKEALEDFGDVAKDVVRACGGLPLALKVIGSSLFDKRSERDRETIWVEAGVAMRQSRDVMDVLRWSYDSLPEAEKRMFVDITCLFNNESTDEALSFWGSCEECVLCGGVPTPHTSLQNLISKSLVFCVERYGVLRVHDLLVELGEEIGKTTKTHFVKGNIGEVALTKKQVSTETMALNLRESRKRKFEVEDFVRMPNLHFLEMREGGIMNGDWRCMSKELRWLRWRNTSLTYVPANLDLSHLTSLDFSKSSKLVALWTESNCGWEGCPNLLRLNLSQCTSMTTLPNSIGQSPCLQYLDLSGCLKLKKLPESVGQLGKLKFLNLRDCKSLKVLPDSIGQASQLESLTLDSCRKLENLPGSIGLLKELQHLRINSCASLKALPDSIGALSNLRDLDAWFCRSLTMLPLSIQLCSSLWSLWLEASTNCETFSAGLIGEAWMELWDLHLRNCYGLASRLDYGAFKSLYELRVVDKTLTEFPESIGLLVRLHDLEIECERLQCLPNSLGDLKLLTHLCLTRCENLKRLPKSMGALTSLKNLHIEDCCLLTKLPSSIGLLSRLSELSIRRCEKLQKLPTSFTQLKNLKRFELRDCGSIDAMGALTTLQRMPIWGSTTLTKLPPSLGVLSRLLIYGVITEFSYPSYKPFVGTCQVLEDDESGWLKVYHDESTGLLSLERRVHEEPE